MLLIGGVKERELDRHLIRELFIYCQLFHGTPLEIKVYQGLVAREVCCHVDGKFAHVVSTEQYYNMSHYYESTSAQRMPICGQEASFWCR